MAAALAGGVFEIGDRVAAITGSGSPAFGSRGTVVGTYDDAVEVRRPGRHPCTCKSREQLLRQAACMHVLLHRLCIFASWSWAQHVSPSCVP